MPRPDFPKTLPEFQRRFPDESACRAYLVASRWPEGYCCPRYGHSEVFDLPRRHLMQCKACGLQTSVTAGTVFHRTRTPLTYWFWAAYLMATQTPGMSALQLQRQLGLNRYETVWTMLHKLRRAMVAPNREPLRGIIEVDETYIGGPEHGKRGRGAGGKALVVGAVEDRGETAGRVRLQLISNSTRAILTAFVEANVEHGATIKTDGLDGYEALDKKHYCHRPRIQGSGERTTIWLPHIHRVFSNLKTWLRGTHHGVDPKHLQAYLGEFVFRYNRRRTPMVAFQTLLGLGSHLGPTTYYQLYRSESTG
ncbi:MAG: IS1595 family transposase [Spirochaetes bacterium]|nr:IS1595 family transposase [Spirochaetota bacterium]